MTPSNGEGSFAILLNKEACIRCGRCFRVCPARAIAISDYPVVDPALCVACGRCIGACPTHALTSGLNRRP